MRFLSRPIALVLSYLFACGSFSLADPCRTIAGRKWVAPREARACLASSELDPQIKRNTLDVVNKTLAFHTSTNYQILAPQPFSEDVHEDILSMLERIRDQYYTNGLQFHIDLSRAFKRLRDGHCMYINACYDALFVTYLPLPLVLLTEVDGSQAVYIAPEAFLVASTEFADQIDFWQKALPGSLKGRLASLSGAKVLLINGKEPFEAVNKNANITGGYQSFGTRQNGFFASYYLADSGWSYLMGEFAEKSLPLEDSVTLTVLRRDTYQPITFEIPYRSRVGSTSKPFNDSASYQANNCVAIPGTNGVDLNTEAPLVVPSPLTKFQQATSPSPGGARRHFQSILLDDTPRIDIALPPILRPSLPAGIASAGMAQFYFLEDGKTGVLALGSFVMNSLDSFYTLLLDGLMGLKKKGATRLIVDVTNNGGGFICAAHWLHRIIVGPKSTTVPKAGLDTEARAGILAQNIVQNIVDKGLDPEQRLMYNPTNWRDANGIDFPSNKNWLRPPITRVINGRRDSFSARLGQECQPFLVQPPLEALFHPSKVIILSNGRCASSCAIFSVVMAKGEGVRTVVFGGRKDVPQEYCGTVGGQSTDFSAIDTEIKTAKLKQHKLAPPDFLTNSIQGIVWRLAFSLDKEIEPEEWQNHAADVNFALTTESVNNPAVIWKSVANGLFGLG